MNWWWCGYWAIAAWAGVVLTGPEARITGASRGWQAVGMFLAAAFWPCSLVYTIRAALERRRR